MLRLYSSEAHKKQAITLLKNRGVAEKTDYVECLKNVYSCAVQKIQSAKFAIRTSCLNDYMGAQMMQSLHLKAVHWPSSVNLLSI